LGIGKRIVDLAKANLNALLDKAGGGDTSVDNLTDEELEAELQRRRERRRRQDEERKVAERAAENARKRGPGPMPPPPKREPRRDKPPPSMGAPPPSDKRLRELYAQLEVPFGAPFEEVKKSFRRLMRKYHPDLHIGNPAKHQTATQLTMSLTQAYNELELHLVGGRRG
jgi:DnaJ-domain-containing protein 1